MSLDVFNPAAADQNVVANAARDLPAGFSEAFDISLRGIGEWNSSTAYNNARDRALASYYDDVKQKTGVQLPLYGMGGNVSIEELNDAIAKLPQAPDQAPQPPLSEDTINGMALSRMAKAHQDTKAFSSRETTWGGTAGTIIGTLTAGLSDPVTAATLPLGGAGEAGIALRALEFAGIAGGTEAVIAGLNFQSHEAAVPGSSHEIPGEIATAAAGGAVLGGAFGLLHKVLGFGAKPLPTSVRDEVNAALSEFQFNATNPFPTAAADGAARDATVDATMAMIRDLPVRSGDDFAAQHVADYAATVAAKNPEELALAGERHLRPVTSGEKPEFQAFDRMPAETETAADYWEKRLESATPEERQALGANDLTAEQTARLAEEPATQEATLHNLDHIAQANPDMEFTTQIRQPDGSYQFETRKLSDVMDELQGWEAAAKEIEACAVGGALEAAE